MLKIFSQFENLTNQHFIYLGGGSIAIAGDGGLRQWQISNKVNHIGHAPNSFFAIK